MRRYVLFICFVLTQQYLHAQNNQYPFSHLDITNGLSSNQVNCIFKDVNGFIWFGTNAGLNRYDGYKFKVFQHDNKDANSLPENFISHIYEGPENKMWISTPNGFSIYNSYVEKFSNNITGELSRYKVNTGQLESIRKDRDGDYWFFTNGNGVYCYHPKSKTTSVYGNSAKATGGRITVATTDIAEDKNNFIWLINNDGAIQKLDKKTNKIVFRSALLSEASKYKTQSYSCTFGHGDNLWIFANSSPDGIYCYNVAKNSMAYFSKDAPVNRLNSNVINNIVLGDDNKIWAGTDHGGINIIDESTFKVQYLLKKDDDIKSLRGNSIQIYKDSTGFIWAGTYKEGVSYYHKGIIQFPIIRHYASDNTSLPYEDVNCFAEDAKGNLWIGTNGGGIIYFNRASNIYTEYKHDPTNPNSLSNDIIVSVFIDRNQKLWIGTYFGGMDRFDGNKFTHYRHNDKISSSISDDRVYSIAEDGAHNMWVGTFAGGLNIYDPKTDGFQHPNYPMSSAYTSILFKDRENNMWIGRDKGIDVVESATNMVRHFGYQPRNHNNLIANDVNNIMQDSRGLIWIATKDGLSVLNSKTNLFINIFAYKDLPSHDILNVLEDKNGRMWLSTSNGLACIQLYGPATNFTYHVYKYDEFDGLQGREFNQNASFKTREGEMIFGGAHGFNLFDPATINNNTPTPKLVLTDFQLFNKSVAVGDTINGKVVLSRSIAQTHSMVLNHNQNVFSIEFAATDFFNPNKIRYQYMLEDFDKGWLTSPTDSRKATYTNLDAGDYVFKVRAANINQPGTFSLITLNIKVLPPFWKTPVAYALYFAMAFGLLLYIRHRGILKIKREFLVKQDKLEVERKIEQEREEARRMHELDLMKIKFFTNVSHEFRTPLSLIISPIDGLIKQNENPDQKHQLSLIKRNGKRLLNLVNQLLDFRKMEFNELKLSLKKGDIISFINEVSSSFTDIAQQKNIKFVFESEVETLTTRFDHDKMERVLFNLLSNAFKFTPPGGHISVLINLINSDAEASDQQLLEIKVMDTGIGIPAEKHERIFDRFFQDNMPESLLNQGSGIGLSITWEFIKMHNGDIKVESEPGYGSCFIIQLPVGVEGNHPVADAPQYADEESPVVHDVDVLGSNKKPVVLLVEDNDDLRFYLKDNLKQHFHIIEAVNGKDGWQKALAIHPNLVVSDVSMPEMNGMELCKKIKADARTAHIPIILLTALTEEDDQLAGLEVGANDFITKPFNFEILLSRINNLLLLQKTIKKTYQKQTEIQAQQIEIVSEDDKFLKNVLSCIENNITNPNFSVEELSRQVSMSRVSLYKRLLTLTGKTPVDCIRTIRLKRAVQLLEKSKLSIAIVAYEVGFNNPTYFAKVFREEYGMLPSEYITEMRKKEKDAVHTV